MLVVRIPSTEDLNSVVGDSGAAGGLALPFWFLVSLGFENLDRGGFAGSNRLLRRHAEDQR